MKQLTQNLKSGIMEILEVPFPALSKGKVLIRNAYSLISAGTEVSKVKTARSSLIKKAQEKPDKVKQVIDSLKTEGMKSTYQKVMNKLDFPSPLGYSCAGKVIEVSDDVTEFQVGDFVACGGADSVHAEVVSVHKNLCVKIPKNVKIEHAAYTTVASIALQGIRQADLRLSESCIVIGLGLIGQLTVQMLKTSGVNVVGIDIDDNMVELATKSGATLAFNRNNNSLENSTLNMSKGHGVDAVIITAGTTSIDPVELAGRLCRKKGKVIIVGAVPTGFTRPNYYKKELELKMSCSYGPGRYDVNYEEKGLNYPIEYVRWTENRNMLAFLELLSNKSLDIDLLTTHMYDFEDAKKAYQLIINKEEMFVGILLKYNIKSEIKVNIKNNKINKNSNNEKTIIGFIGAGSFAQKFLLPNVNKNCDLFGVATASGNNSKNIVDKFNFKYAFSDYNELIKKSEVNTIFIATRHNLHAECVLKSLQNGKNVFIEKPLCLKESELEEIKNEYEKNNVSVMVGFNRRFSPHIKKVKQIFDNSRPKAINYRINVGNIPSDHWTHDPEIGGGRIIGEVCHFLDLSMYLADSMPKSISANVMDSNFHMNDTLVINVKFKNGSIANISYFANGSKALAKEYLEIFSDGVTAVIDDFKKLTIYDNRKKVSHKINDKGHKEGVKQFLDSIAKGNIAPISFEDIYMTTKMTFDVIKSIKNNKLILY